MVRALEALPTSRGPDRAEYSGKLLAMAPKLKTFQGKDGCWRPSLEDAVNKYRRNPEENPVENRSSRIPCAKSRVTQDGLINQAPACITEYTMLMEDLFRRGSFLQSRLAARHSSCTGWLGVSTMACWLRRTTGDKMMNFVLNMMGFVLNVRKFVFEMMDFVLKMMNSALKMMNSALKMMNCRSSATRGWACLTQPSPVHYLPFQRTSHKFSPDYLLVYSNRNVSECRSAQSCRMGGSGGVKVVALLPRYDKYGSST